MVQTISADKITLYDLNQRFQLVQTTDPSFFPEWQDSLPTLTAEEKQRLERIRTIVANLEQRSVLENTIKLAVIAPLLDLSGFFLPLFYVSTEDSSHTADTAGLAQAYGVFACEAQAHQPGYCPESVHTDGWAQTQTAWQTLFPGVSVILCFLHAILSLQKSLRRTPEQ
jgi:hypothetical protein